MLEPPSEKSDVKYSAYDGIVKDALDAMKEAGSSKAVVVDLFGSGNPAFERGPALADQTPQGSLVGSITGRPRRRRHCRPRTCRLDA